MGTSPLNSTTRLSGSAVIAAFISGFPPGYSTAPKPSLTICVSAASSATRWVVMPRSSWPMSRSCRCLVASSSCEGERDITPRVRWRVPTGRTALGGTGVCDSTSFLSLSRAVAICGRLVEVMRGRQRKCVNGGFFGLDLLYALLWRWACGFDGVGGEILRVNVDVLWSVVRMPLSVLLYLVSSVKSLYSPLVFFLPMLPPMNDGLTK